MKKLILVLFFLLSFARVSNAQILIHQYPYDSSVTSYSSSTTWPLLSAQCHWRPANSNLDTTSTPQLQSPQIGHTHLEMNWPIYGEMTGDFVVPFTIMLYHVDGLVHPWESPYSDWNGLISGVTYDNLTTNDLVGDPNGLKMWTGHFTVHLGPARGWLVLPFGVHTYFSNGDQSRVSLEVPIYLMTDPSAPELVSDTPDEQMKTDAKCQAGSNNRDPAGSGIFGISIVQYNAYLPILAPIKSFISQAIPFSYNYGLDNSAFTAPGIAMTREDMNLHQGIIGSLLQSQSVPLGQLSNLNSPFDPAILGSGVHKVAAIWQQDSGAGIPGVISANEQVTALLVVSITVGDTPPPPVPTWQTLTGIFQQQIQPDPTQFQFCDTMGMNCTAFIKK